MLLDSKNFFDGVAELVVLHQDGFGGQASAELDVVDGLVIGGIGDAHVQLVAAPPQRQGVMLAHQFFADQACGLGFFVQAVEVQQGDAEMLRGDLRDLAALDQFVLHQIADQGDAIALSLLIRLLRTLLGEQFGQHQLLGQAAEGDVIHGNPGGEQFMTYSLVKPRRQTSGAG